jgi:hypothetical protein
MACLRLKANGELAQRDKKFNNCFFISTFTSNNDQTGSAADGAVLAGKSLRTARAPCPKQLADQAWLASVWGS